MERVCLRVREAMRLQSAFSECGALAAATACFKGVDKHCHEEQGGKEGRGRRSIHVCSHVCEVIEPQICTSANFYTCFCVHVFFICM